MNYSERYFFSREVSICNAARTGSVKTSVKMKIQGKKVQQCQIIRTFSNLLVL